MINLNDPLIRFLWVALISFISAFSKTLNDYASTPNTMKKYSFLFFISKVLLSGVCGVLIGALTNFLSTNVYLVTFSCGVGGIIGIRSIRIGIKILFSIKKIPIDVIKSELDETKDKKE